MCIKHVYPNTLQVSSIKLISSIAGLLASLCSLLPDEERSLVFAETRARSILPCQVLALTKTKNQERQKSRKPKNQERQNQESGKIMKTNFVSSLPEGTLCYSEGEIQHFCQVNNQYWRFSLNYFMKR